MPETPPEISAPYPARLRPGTGQILPWGTDGTALLHDCGPSLQGARRQELAGEIALWRPVLRCLNLPGEVIRGAEARARANGTTLQAELLVSGHRSEADFFQAIAAVLGIDFLRHVEADTLALRNRDGLALLRSADGPRFVRSVTGDGTGSVFVAPNLEGFRRILERKDIDPGLLARLRITTQSAMRAAISARCERVIGERAIAQLFDALPYCSSRLVLTGFQGFAAGGLVTAFAAAMLVAPRWMIFVAHLFFSGFFFACATLRLAAASHAQSRRRTNGLRRFETATLPRYSVLVALYREDQIVPELLQALGALVWPRSKLEIKLVCEADDQATIAALEAHELRPWVEIVRVPPGLPRTKPKALAHALHMATGDIVVLYDAEDKPHPWQLLEAHQRFEASDASLACVQAPLVISNGRRSLFSRLFAFEYSALFRGMLPFLSAYGLVLPLGGTSNHFRRDALEKIGGWDPFNVTEDADLGLRMRRFGYRTETIDYPTYETAPENWKDWRNQRTRWMKGWIQTWFVHMRSPLRLVRELGAASFLVTQIIYAGMVVSALVYPLFLLTIIWFACTIAAGGAQSWHVPAIIALDFSNILLGYGAYFLLGRTTLPRERRHGIWLVALCTPLYWFMQSIAAWRAVFQLRRDPHLCGVR